MTFLAPWMLAGAAAVGIPLALHFLYRARYKPQPWGAMKFLRLSIEQTARRLKFQEWILLLLRCLVLLLLAFALARPAASSLQGVGQGDPVNAVFLMDVSYSMAARDGTSTRLDRAKAAARRVLDQLPSGSTVRIIPFAGDWVGEPGPESPGNFDQARLVLDRLQLTGLATDYEPALAAAQAALQLGSLPSQEVYLFSDLQRLGFDQQAAGVKARARAIHQQAGLYLVRCGRHRLQNVAIVDLLAQGGIPHTQSRASFTALVRNSGTEAVRNLTVSLELANRVFAKESRPIAELGPGQTTPVTLSVLLEEPGRQVLTASVQNDDLETDNRLQRVIDVREQVRVLVVDGSEPTPRPEQEASFYLLHALRPVSPAAWLDYHIQPRRVTPQGALPALLADKDVCILVDVPLSDPPTGLRQDFIDRLIRFVQDGKGLWIIGGPQVKPADYNAMLGSGVATPLLPADLAQAVTAPVDRPFHPAVESIPTGSYLAGFQRGQLQQINDVEVFQSLRLVDLPTEARVLLRFASGDPMLLSRPVGAGEVLLLTTNLDPRWTDWPVFRTSYLPFVHASLAHLTQGSVHAANRTAGESLAWYPPDLTQTYQLVRPDGQTIVLGRPDGRNVDARLALTTRATELPGIYRMVAMQPPRESESPRPDSTALFALCPDLRESEQLDAFTSEQIDGLLGFSPVQLSAGSDFAAVVGSQRWRQEWTMWFLLGLFGLLCGETLWAWKCGRPL